MSDNPQIDVGPTIEERTLGWARKLVETWGGKTPYKMGGASWETGMDCSEFAARCVGRKKFDGRKYWNTDAIYHDALTKQTCWMSIPKPVPGCLGVYGGRMANGKRRAGHVWIVEDVEGGGTIECCSGYGVCRRVRKSWFAPNATGNGWPILWVVPVE